MWSWVGKGVSDCMDKGIVGMQLALPLIFDYMEVEEEPWPSEQLLYSI